jgi:hypothetical protein
MTRMIFNCIVSMATAAASGRKLALLPLPEEGPTSPLLANEDDPPTPTVQSAAAEPKGKGRWRRVLAAGEPL